MTFTSQAANISITQIFLTKTAPQDTTGATTNITDEEIFAYVDVPDILLNTSDSVTYTWTVDVD